MSRRCDEAASAHLAQVERGGSEGHVPTALHGVPSCGNQDDTSHVRARVFVVRRAGFGPRWP